MRCLQNAIIAGLSQESSDLIGYHTLDKNKYREMKKILLAFIHHLSYTKHFHMQELYPSYGVANLQTEPICLMGEHIEKSMHFT